jgi:hypothetical protein
MSSLRSQELKATAGDPFENCRLDRKKYAEILTSIIETYEDGFVLGLNNKWGEGKTTFIRMWRLYLGQPERGFKTLYFNAWEHDFNNDPLSAILSELKTLDIYDKKKFAPLIKKGAKLTMSLAPVLLNALAEKYVDTKLIKEAFQKLSEEAASIFEEEVNEYAEKKKGLEDFKIELESYISKLEKKPLVFFIDELDRCNPKYAVEFLEMVKHFFSVSGIVFVVSIDKEQLSHSIKGYFGSENLNTEEYLRRFIDLEYSIPAPKLEDYIHYMFEKSEINEFIRNENRRINSSLNAETNLIYELAYSFFTNFNFNLRQIDKILIHTSLVLKTFRIRDYIFPEAVFTLIIIKFSNIQLYNQIKQKKLNPQEFLDALSPYLNLGDEFREIIDLPHLEVFLLYVYCKKEGLSGINGIWELGSNDYTISIKSNLVDDLGYFMTDFESRIKKIQKIENYINLDLSYIISRIELLNGLRNV